MRVVQIYFGNDQPWDDHQDINRHREHARKSDQPIAALIRDLKARGMLEETLVDLGRGVRPHSNIGRSEGPRPPQPGIHNVAGRRRCQGGLRARCD